MRVQRESLALMNLVVKRQRTKHPKNSVKSAREQTELVLIQVGQQSQVLRHHDVVAAREQTDRARISNDPMLILDDQLQLIEQLDHLVE
jgi:hypothetical protein